MEHGRNEKQGSYGEVERRRKAAVTRKTSQWAAKPQGAAAVSFPKSYRGTSPTVYALRKV